MRLAVAMIASCMVVASFAHAEASRFDEATKQALLDDHNARRARLARGEVPGQPGASNMNALVWDDALEAVAARWAGRCEWKHNPNAAADLDTRKARFRTEPGRRLGENLYATTDTEVALSVFLGGHDKWWAEHERYDRGRCKGVCGHYTQLAWAATRYVGCAYARCESLGRSGRPQLLYVCNYFPAGNVDDAFPYETGAACSRCDADRRGCKDGLCAGCMAPAFSFCADRASNCAKLAGSCPADCSLESDVELCQACRTTCRSCPKALLEPASSCRAVP